MPWAGFLLYIDATPVYRGQIVQDNKPFRPINRSIPSETGAWRPFPAVQDYELQTVLPGLLSAEIHSRWAPGPVQDPEPPDLSLYLWTLRTFAWCCLVQGHAWGPAEPMRRTILVYVRTWEKPCLEFPGRY
jgi:hypothetical protein